MSDYFKYYGFYGRKGNTDEINIRTKYQEPSTDPQVNNKEFGVYVHTEKPEIIEHLEIEYSKSSEYGKHYGNVKNLNFQPIKGLLDDDIKIVQDLIDECYSFLISSDNPSDKQISWAKMHALAREYMYSGYNSELSNKIINMYANNAHLEASKDIYDDNTKKNLEIQSQRTCDKIHSINNIEEGLASVKYNKIILEDYILKEGEKQLILGFGGKNNDIKQYKNNPKIFNDPWLSRSSYLGFYVWNIMINKATIKCILDNNKILFPIQIILSTNPNYLFVEQIDINKSNIQYIGYFIARINLDKLEKPQNIDPECEKLYDYTFDKIPNSKEQYFVILIFKNLDKDIKYDIDRYILTDFRLQRIHWGNLTRSKRVLFIEIEQLMCSSLYENNDQRKANFYLLSEYIIGKHNSVNELCKSQLEEINNSNNSKKTNNQCYEAWIDKNTFKLLNDKKYKLIGTSYNVLVSTYNLRDIEIELKNRNKNKENIDFFSPDDKSFEHLLITEKLDNGMTKDYILFPCHFKWEDTGNNVKDKKYNTKKIFVLKHGYLKLINDENLTRGNPNYFNSEQYYKKELCINSNCIFNRDYIMHTSKHIKLFNNNIKTPGDYIEILNKIKQNQLIEQKGGNKDFKSLSKLFNKIKLYKQNFKNIVLSNKAIYSENKDIYNRYLGFNILHIFDNNNNTNTNIYSNITNFINNNLFFLPLIQHIINGNILIISTNINVLVILDYYLNIDFSNITLVLINIHINNLINIFSVILKNRDKIKIYYFGNLVTSELINCIVNYFSKIKFNNIIIDIVDNSNQEFYNILGIKICKRLLNYKGSYIQLSKVPDLNDNLIYLYYFIFKCFRYNLYENHTNYLLKDNMYSLIYHKNFEYNLNDEEENVIDQLLKNHTNLNITSLLSKISFNKLFIDFIKIKYLTMYYNLQNYAEKIFKISYNIIENKTIEQQGGYQVTKNTNLHLYDSKYTCTFLEKQLFLLHLNCLTKVYLYENKNLDNFYIYYDDIITSDDKGYGYYQEILKNMFKQLTWTNKQIKSKECIFISNNLDMYHKIKPKYALMDLKPDTDKQYFDGEILYTLYPFSNSDFKILVKEYNKIKEYSENIFQELLDNNKFLSLCYNNDLYNINKVIPIKYLKLIPGYSDNFECILEYKILYNYFYHIHDITDHKIIINKLFDITIDKENNMKYWLTCSLKKFQKSDNETDIMFKNIIQLNIEQHAKHQIQLLKDYGSEVFDKDNINKAIKILGKYASDRVYIQII